MASDVVVMGVLSGERKEVLEQEKGRVREKIAFGKR